VHGVVEHGQLATEVLDQCLQAEADTVSTLLGTPQYLPPEIWAGWPASTRSDVYAIGLVLYELCEGRLPHADLSFDELSRAAMRDDLPPMQRRRR
jgi:serine/threonine protein kinase